jgi:MFS family permease
MAGLSLVGGHVADRNDRVHVLAASVAVTVLCAALLATFAALGTGTLPIYGVIVLFGAARAFSGPASGALLPNLVPPEHFANAVAWNGTTWQLATIAGPAFGGLLYWLFDGPAGAYAVACGLDGLALAFIVSMRARAGAAETGAPEMGDLLKGLGFLRDSPIVLGAIALDLFAVLLGGATALLPIFARDVLHVGSVGLGLLRSAPAAGAAVCAVLLARYPIKERAGTALFASVALFGLATIAFGLSRSFVLSLAALFLLGASDMVSVVIRNVLVQVNTPDAMRGRVTAVNMVFISASNELGDFESGVIAQLFGAVRAVLIGGFGTLAVVGFTAWAFPALRRIDRVDRPAPVDDTAASGGVP